MGLIRLARLISKALHAFGRGSTPLYATTRDFSRLSTIERVFTRQALWGSFFLIGISDLGPIRLASFSSKDLCAFGRGLASVRDYTRLRAIERDLARLSAFLRVRHSGGSFFIRNFTFGGQAL